MLRFLPLCLALIVGCNAKGTTSAIVSNTASSSSGDQTATKNAGASSPATQPLTNDQAAEAIAAAADGNAFAFDLYARLREQQQGGLFFSPYIIHVALAMTAAGARGATADEMLSVLHCTDMQHGADMQHGGEIDDVHSAVAALAQSLRYGAERDGYQLTIANRLWGQQGQGFLSQFLDLTRDRYGAELAQVDFAENTEHARETINAWVEDETRQKIQELLQPGMVDSLTKLVLTNAIYFKGQWTSKFNETLTSDSPFHVSADETVNVPLMFQTAEFRHHAADDLQIVELPYGEGLSMVVLLPDKVDGLAALETKLSAENLERWLSNLAPHRVTLHLPKFKMTSQFSLEGVLHSLGIRSAFTPGEADFSGMTGGKDLFISAVVHKAFVDVNEEGTEAAAATAVVSRAPGPVERTEIFRADHPFVFLIRDHATGSILFLGRVVNPKQPAA